MYRKVLFVSMLAAFVAGFLAFPLQAQSDFFPEEMIVTASSLKLRAKPDIAGQNVIESLSRGTVVKVVSVANSGEVVEVNGAFAPWYEVMAPSGKKGYAFGAFLSGTYGLFYEDQIIEGDLPPVEWYGVYQRDSFSDEVRKITVTTKKEFNEMYGEDMNVLKTNQKDTSKFIIGTIHPLPTGYAGPLGIMDSPGWFFEGGLNPGAMVPVSSGQMPGDTVYGETLFLTATGCATLKDSYVQITGFQIHVMEMLPDNSRIQDLSPWFKYEPDLNPSVQLLWYGDLDHDRFPDVLIHDCPMEMGCRSSLFLSSKAKKGEILRKVCEYYWYGD
jgi:Bacterial SH3 domain